MIALVLGGTRSGKSAVAEEWVTRRADGVPVTYLATAVLRADDADHEARVQAHRQRRPAHWRTLEPDPRFDLAQTLAEVAGPVLLDSLGTWVAGHFDGEHGFAMRTGPLLEALTSRTSDTIVVSEEVGMSVHAPTAVGRRYADALGSLNREVAAIADRAVLVVAGRVLPLSTETPW